MKKIIFILDEATAEEVKRFREELMEQRPFVIGGNDKMKIFLMDGDDIKQIYPAVKYERVKIGDLEIETTGEFTERDQLREEMLEKAEKEERLKNSVQRIKPIKIDPKIMRMSQTPPGKRFRRTKKEMLADRDEPQAHIKSVGKRYPEDVDEFIEKNWREYTDKELVEIFKKTFDKEYTKEQIKSHRKEKGWVNSRGKEKVSKKEIKIEISPEIYGFIELNKKRDIFELRDLIIEEFGSYIPLVKLRKAINKKKIPGESVGEEVKRIEDQREDDFGDDLDLD